MRISPTDFSGGKGAHSIPVESTPPAAGRLCCRNLILPICVLLIGAVATGFLYQSLLVAAEAENAANFDAVVTRCEEAIQNRVVTYVDALRGGASLFAASEAVERREWKAYVDSLRIVERYPGVSGMGVIWSVAKENLPSFLEKVRADGAADFTVRSVPGVAAPEASDYLIITYIEPEKPNEPALGLDVGSDPSRRAGAERSRDLGQPMMTSRITLVQDKLSRPGFLLYVPVYKKGVGPLKTVQQRREAFEAWIYAPFVTEKFFESVLGREASDVGVEIFEGEQIAQQQMVYSADNPTAEAYDRVTRVELAGQTYTLCWKNHHDSAWADAGAATLAASCGALLSVTLAGLTWSLQSSRRANAIVTQQSAKLMKSEQRFRQLVESSPSGMIKVDSQDRIVLVNSTVEKMFGYQREEIVGMHIDVLIPDRFRPQHMTYRRVFHANPVARQIGVGRDVYALHKDGHEFPVEIALSPMEAEDGVAVLATIVDITTRKQAERAVLASKKRLQDILDSMYAFVELLTLDGIVLETNRSPLDAAGLSREQVLGRPCWDTYFWSYSPKVQEQVREALRRAAAGEVVRYDKQARIKNGRMIDIDIMFGPLSDPEGRINQVLVFAVDITQRKKAEEELRWYADQLQKTNRDLESLVYTVSHDLKAPLVTFTGYLSLLSSDIVANRHNRIPLYTDYLSKASNQMSQIINDVLEISRIGREPNKPQVIEVKRLVESIIELLKPQIDAQNIQMEVNDLPTVTMDRIRLRQVFQNLLTNALKYGCSKQESKITIGSKTVGEEIRLYVSDNGPGVPKQFHSKIFDLFQRLNSTKEGTGVGLAIVARIAETYGGRAWVESEEGQGATFWVSLPLKISTSQEPLATE